MPLCLARVSCVNAALHVPDACHLAALAACWLQRHAGCRRLKRQTFRWPGPALPALQRLSWQQVLEAHQSRHIPQLLCCGLSCMLPVLLIWSGATTALYMPPAV